MIVASLRPKKSIFSRLTRSSRFLHSHIFSQDNKSIITQRSAFRMTGGEENCASAAGEEKKVGMVKAAERHAGMGLDEKGDEGRMEAEAGRRAGGGTEGGRGTPQRCSAGQRGPTRGQFRQRRLFAPSTAITSAPQQRQPIGQTNNINNARALEHTNTQRLTHTHTQTPEPERKAKS